MVPLLELLLRISGAIRVYSDYEPQNDGVDLANCHFQGVNPFGLYLLTPYQISTAKDIGRRMIRYRTTVVHTACHSYTARARV